MTKNTQESLRLQKAVKAKHKQCFINAVRVVWNVREYHRATYVEGIAVVDGMCIEHGWVEHDGEILDPTLPQEDMIYFAGLRFEGEPGIAEGIKRPKPKGAEDLPFFYRYGWGGKDSPEFCQAWQQALEFVNGVVAAG
jgi:hypothetical protein